MENLKNDITAAKVCNINNSCDVPTPVDIYNDIMAELLDEHAPEVTKTITVHPGIPCYKSSLPDMKRAKRKAQRTWRNTKLEDHRQIYVAQRGSCSDCLRGAEQDYYVGKITESSDQKSLYDVLDSLTKTSTKPTLPDSDSDSGLANRLCDHFDKKVSRLSLKLDTNSTSQHQAPPAANFSPPFPLSSFEPATAADVCKTIMKSKSTTCNLDP